MTVADRGLETEQFSSIPETVRHDAHDQLQVFVSPDLSGGRDRIMNDPRDFLAWTGFGTVGSLLLALGLLGCLLHRSRLRRLASAAVSLTGSLLLLDGAQLFHGTQPAVAVSTAVAVSGLAVTLFLWPRDHSGQTTPDTAAPPPVTAENRSKSHEKPQHLSGGTAEFL